MARITDGLLVDLAKQRLLSPAFEDGYAKHKVSPVNPVSEALRNADARTMVHASRDWAIFTLICFALLLVLIGVYTWFLPKTDLALALAYLAIMLGVGFAAACCIVKARPYLWSVFYRQHPRFDIVEHFLGLLNRFWYWNDTDLVFTGQLEHFLTLDKEALFTCAEGLIEHAACEVVRFQRSQSAFAERAHYSWKEADLRSMVEKRYDTLKHFDLVTPGGVGPYYRRAEAKVDAEEAREAERQAREPIAPLTGITGTADPVPSDMGLAALAPTADELPTS